jgi:hypothetical protein
MHLLHQGQCHTCHCSDLVSLGKRLADSWSSATQTFGAHSWLTQETLGTAGFVFAYMVYRQHYPRFSDPESEFSSADFSQAFAASNPIAPRIVDALVERQMLEGEGFRQALRSVVGLSEGFGMSLQLNVHYF